jgi:hypothetical protein
LKQLSLSVAEHIVRFHSGSDAHGHKDEATPVTIDMAPQDVRKKPHLTHRRDKVRNPEGQDSEVETNGKTSTIQTTTIPSRPARLVTRIVWKLINLLMNCVGETMALISPISFLRSFM